MIRVFAPASLASTLPKIVFGVALPLLVGGQAPGDQASVVGARTPVVEFVASVFSAAASTVPAIVSHVAPGIASLRSVAATQVVTDAIASVLPFPSASPTPSFAAVMQSVATHAISSAISSEIPTAVTNALPVLVSCGLPADLAGVLPQSLVNTGRNAALAALGAVTSRVGHMASGTDRANHLQAQASLPSTGDSAQAPAPPHPPPSHEPARSGRTKVPASRKGTSQDASGESAAGSKSSPESAGKPSSKGSSSSAESKDSTGSDTKSGTGEDEENDAWESHPNWSMHVSNDAAVTFGPTEVIVPAGEKNLDDIVSIGGRVTVHGDAQGDITVIAGVLTISGDVRGDVVAVGSRVYLEDGARIHGSMTSVVGRVHRAPDVHVGDTYTSVDFPVISNFATGHGAFAYLVTILFWATILFTAFRFLAILVIAAVAPARIDTALATPRPSWVLAFFLGLLVYAFGHLLVALFCILLPLGVALWIALHVAIWMGLAAIYLHVGRSIGRTAFGRSLSYFGAILTGFALFALLGLIPCFGWVLNGMASMCGLGLMLLTRFGSGKRSLPLPPLPLPPPVKPSTPS